MERFNPTQATLNRASACRALDMMETTGIVREMIRPIKWRRIAALAIGQAANGRAPV
jgi:hypothetical protein